LLGTAAEVLTMCCFFGAAWVRPCCIGMIRVGSYDLLRVVPKSLSMHSFSMGNSVKSGIF
jgi:hypothetical protein